MAVDLTEVSTFDANVTVPQPGDLRKAASVVLFAQQLADRTRYLLNRTRGGFFDVSRSPYSAVGNGVADDTSALQDAIDDAAAANGGDVFLSALHRTTAALIIPPGVNLVGVPGGKSSIAIDHATAKTLSFTSGTNAAQYSVVSGIYFSALQDNSGAVIYNDGATVAKVLVENCSFGGSSHSKGIALDFNGNSGLHVRDCEFIAHGGIDVVHHNGAFGWIALESNRFVVPAIGYSSLLVACNGANLRGNFEGNIFNAESAIGGTMNALNLTAGFYTYSGNHFKGSVAATLIALSAPSGAAHIREGSNTYGAAATAYDPAMVLLDDESRLNITKLARTAGGGTTFTWPNDVETLEFEGAAAVPTFALPLLFHKGRKIRLLIRNASGSAWGAIGLTGAAFLSNIPAMNLANGESGIIDLEVATVVPPNAPIWTVTHRGP